jgi:fermentation-respiration switch protein FrsA (DUF1100 family)
MKKLKKVIGWIILIYVCGVATLFIKQRSLIFVPDKTPIFAISGTEKISVTTQDGLTIHAIYKTSSMPSKPTIIMFHGNAGNAGHRLFKVKPYVDQGYGILLAEYRGYGGNDGIPSEEGFYHDGRAYMNWLTQNKNITNIVIYGESVGSGTATQMAEEYDIAGLILEVPFSSLLDVAQNLYFLAPVKYLIKDPFMNHEKIANINAPLLILHGHKDSIIPYKFAKKLYNHAIEPKTMIDFPDGGHNDLYNFGAHTHILTFLNTLDTPK